MPMPRTVDLQGVDCLPPEVADVIAFDLEDRENDLFCDATREGELNEAVSFLRDGQRLPRNLYLPVASAIELTLKYRPQARPSFIKARGELEAVAAALRAAG